MVSGLELNRGVGGCRACMVYRWFFFFQEKTAYVTFRCLAFIFLQLFFSSFFFFFISFSFSFSQYFYGLRLEVFRVGKECRPRWSPCD